MLENINIQFHLVWYLNLPFTRTTAVNTAEKGGLTTSGHVERHKVTKSKLFIFSAQVEAGQLSRQEELRLYQESGLHLNSTLDFFIP